MTTRTKPRLFLTLITILLLCSTGLTLHASNQPAEPVVITNRDKILPVGKLAERSIGLITLGARSTATFEDICSRYAMIDTDHIASADDIGKALDLAAESDLLIVAVSSAEQWVCDAMRQLISGRPVIAVYFIPENKIALFADCGTPRATIIADAVNAESQSSAAQIIFGGKAATAKLSNRIPGIADKGRGLTTPKTRLGYCTAEEAGFSDNLRQKIDSIVELNISKKSFPGCQVVVARKGNVIIDSAYGTLGFNNKKKVKRTTLFDIASMTKATATLSGLMKAYDHELFRLDKPVADYLPRMRETQLDGLTVKDFLFHQTGLPSSINTASLVIDTASYSGRLFSNRSTGPYSIKVDKGLYVNSDARLRSDLFRPTPSKDFPNEITPSIFACNSAIEIVNDALYSRPVREKKYLYSDINFCILKDMIESLTSTPLDLWVDNQIFLPLGAHYSTFCPASNGWEVNEIAPTETDRFLRRQTLQGYVHDETAAFLGGVSGNAGLFSTAGDIAKLCQTWLNRGSYGDVRLFSPKTVETFTSTRSSADRGLGFDLAGRVKSFRETGINPLAYGHTGFTGTCFWVDPDEEIIIVVITNRVNPTRDTPTFNSLQPRQEIIRAVYSALRTPETPDKNNEVLTMTPNE